MKPPIAIIVPTFRRPAGLQAALRSLFAQGDVAHLVREIVVVDNDSMATALAVIDGLRDESPWPLVLVHEPRAGVANARNAALSATSAPTIAFLDDDETANSNWLSMLYQAHLTLGADVTFSPIRGVADGAPDDCRDWLNGFFSRTGPADTRLIDYAYGCGASIMNRATSLSDNPPFDAAANATGGEDDRLFTQLEKRGIRFGWAADAWVTEYAPPHRTTAAYALSRAVAYGQSPCQKSFQARPVKWLVIMWWMLIGLAQATGFGAAYAVLWVLDRRKAWPMADRAARGLGKLFWMIRLEFYGVASRG